MRWSIIRLIWFRELRDQLRDRRTLFMIAILPILLYPLAGLGMMQLALGFLGQKNTIRIVGYKNLPPYSPQAHESLAATALFALTPPGPGAPLTGVERFAGAAALNESARLAVWTPRYSPAAHVAAWLAMTPNGAGCPLDGIERLTCVFALAEAARLDYPPLLENNVGHARFLPAYFENGKDPRFFILELADFPPGTDPDAYLKSIDRSDLDTRKVDLIVVVPPGFSRSLYDGERPALHLLVREGDDRSRLVLNRINGVLNRWKERLKETRLLRKGLPADFDEPFEVRDFDSNRSSTQQASKELSKILSQVFPFVLVMWSLAGALYPAVDLCAGEKERGTMETLLISPASREEIVWGKFLTIWVFSAVTALLNLVSMGLTTWFFTRGATTGQDISQLMQFRLSFLIWGAILLVPLSAFFSALCLAVGVYARSSKEGQYYLMPLFILTMPLVFLTLAPGVELNHFYSMVPVTGVALLLQSLIKSGTVTSAHWMYFLPVLAPMVIYSWLALRWAIEQFQREEVLFREAERLDIGLWLRHLFRDKDLIPSTGQAMFCFLVVLVIHWMTMNAFMQRGPDLKLLLVGYLVCLAVPLFMALILTRRPLASLGLRRPPLWAWPAAMLLAVLLFIPGAESTYTILSNVPAIRDSIKASLPQLRDSSGVAKPLTFALVSVPLIQGIFEEITFRGFVLNGIRRHFRPWMAIVLSAFLFSLFQMNVFQCVPHFLLGTVLGLLAWRSGSVYPAIVMHVIYDWLLYQLSVEPPAWMRTVLNVESGELSPLSLSVGGVSAALAVAVLVGMAYLSRKPDAVEQFGETARAKTG